MRADQYGDLPIDSDLEVEQPPRRPPLPVHLGWRYLGLVAIGGAVGTAIREVLTLAIPLWQGFPVATFLCNVVGAFVLGVVLEALVRRGPDGGKRRTVRLLVGTGMLGGFTTFSSLATDTALRLTAAQAPIALAYSLGTLVLGAAASWAGIAVAAAIHRRRVSGAARTRSTGS